MRFNNDDYLQAFPREERAASSPEKTIVKDEPGDVFDDQDGKQEPDADPETKKEPYSAGGEENGNE